MSTNKKKTKTGVPDTDTINCKCDKSYKFSYEIMTYFIEHAFQ